MTDAQRQLLSILVLDFGYDRYPTYGHTPIRHQMAWNYATEGVEAVEVDDFIKYFKAIAEGESGWKDHWERRLGKVPHD